MPYQPPADVPDSTEVPPAVVTVSPFPFTNSDGKFAADPGSEDVSIFTDFLVVSKLEKDHHRYMMGVTSPGGNTDGTLVSFVQLASPTLLWICDWTAEKWEECPSIPDPKPNDSDWILLDEFVEPGMVVVTANGVTPKYRISGTYVYGHKRPNPNILRNANFSLPPWLQDVFNRTVPDNALTKNLIDSPAANFNVGGGNARVVP